jgi:lysine 2,3-aminomutase
MREAKPKEDPLFPTLLTPFIKRMLARSAAFRKQYLFSGSELGDVGTYKPWYGVFDTGIRGLERMYVDRCVFLPVNTCPAYCRFCVRKDYLAPSEKSSMSDEDIRLALDYVQRDESLVDVLISGGEPIMALRKLHAILNGLGEIKHVRIVRIATRCVAYDPDRITPEFVSMLSAHEKTYAHQKIEIETHFNHPDEIQEETTAAASRIREAGFTLTSKTALLRGVNDDEETLLALLSSLRITGIQPYYMLHCINPRGAGHFRTTVERGFELKRFLRGGRASGRIIPQYVLLSPVGKIEPGVDSEIIERDGSHLVIRTPCRPATFPEHLQRAFRMPEDTVLDDDGFVVVRYPDGRPDLYPSPEDPGIPVK